MTTPEAALWFLPLAIPICLWVAWSDLKYMLIPNYAVLALLAVFAVVGFIVLPLEEYAWRWSHFAVALAIGFTFTMIGGMGAGDAKFAAVMAPFVALPDALGVLGLFAACLLGTFVLHRMVRRMGVVKRNFSEWVSMGSRKFPMGIALITTLLIYLAKAASKLA